MPQDPIEWLDEPIDAERPFDVAEATLTIRDAETIFDPEPRFRPTLVKVTREQIERLLAGGQILTVEVHQESTVMTELEAPE